MTLREAIAIHTKRSSFAPGPPTKGAVALFLATIVAVFGIGYLNARVTVSNQRHSCVNSAHDKINYINNFRVIYNADKSAGSPLRTEEANALNNGILAIDLHVDYHYLSLLKSPVDRGIAAKAHFSCDALYPEPPIL